MFFKFILCLVITSMLWKNVVLAKTLRRQEIEEVGVPEDTDQISSYDYDYDNAPRRFPFYRYQEKSNPTTPRPFMSYWQNIMRNVRVPVPSITWNVTNPLANLFHMPEDHPLDDSYVLDSQQRHKPKRRRKHSHKKRHRKNKHPQENFEFEQQDESATQEQQMLLQQYQNPLEPNAPMYFYDPNTDAYYTVQRVRALGSYIEGTYYNPPTTDLVGQTPRGNDQPDVPVNTVGSNSKGMENAISDEEDVDNDIDLDEVEEIDLDKENLNDIQKKSKPEMQKEKLTNQFIHEETLRNVLGTYMLDDNYTRQRQRTKEQRGDKNTTKHKPRDNLRYFFLLNRN